MAPGPPPVVVGKLRGPLDEPPYGLQETSVACLEGLGEFDRVELTDRSSGVARMSNRIIDRGEDELSPYAERTIVDETQLRAILEEGHGIVGSVAEGGSEPLGANGGDPDVGIVVFEGFP